MVPFHGDDISQSSPAKLFHFSVMKYLRVIQLYFSTLQTLSIVELSSQTLSLRGHEIKFSSWPFPLRGHELLQSFLVKLFHFVDMKYDRVLQLNFSISWTLNMAKFFTYNVPLELPQGSPVKHFTLRRHEIPQISPVKLFQFVPMNFRFLQWNSSTSWT